MNDKKTDVVALYAKGIAIFSIVAAHCSTVPSTASEIDQIVSRFLEIFGTLGIGVFFYYAGFFFSKSKKGLVDFIKVKFRTIILPWIICGTLVYLYVYLRNGKLGLWTWFNCIMGNGTYLYFLNVLMIFYVCMYVLRERKIVLLGLAVLSVCSIVITEFSSILQDFNPYLNPFNFAIWFILGMLINYENGRIGELCKKSCWYSSLIVIVLIWFLVVEKIPLSYFKLCYIPLEFAAIWCIVGIAQNMKNELIKKVGELSFAIYLLHMPFAGIIANLFNRFTDFWGLTVLRPAIVVGLTVGCISMVKILCKKSEVLNRLLFLIGVRS